MSNLLARFLVSVVFVPGILALLYIVPPIGFWLLTFAATGIAAYELFGMVCAGSTGSRVVGVALSLATNAAMYWGHTDARIAPSVLIAVPLIGLLMPLVFLGDIQTAGFRAATFAFGPLYCGVPLSLLAIFCKFIDPGFVILSLMLAWFSDTMGYFAGRFLGKHKLYEAVSPKKTIEGSIGGLVGSCIGATWASLHFLRGKFPLHHAIPLAILAGALGQAGDLVESLFKRSTGVKDSGGILPGHGGILDRIDAMMFTTSAVYLYLLWR